VLLSEVGVSDLSVGQLTKAVQQEVVVDHAVVRKVHEVELQSSPVSLTYAVRHHAIWWCKGRQLNIGYNLTPRHLVEQGETIKHRI